MPTCPGAGRAWAVPACMWGLALMVFTLRTLALTIALVLSHHLLLLFAAVLLWRSLASPQARHDRGGGPDKPAGRALFGA